MRVVRFLKIVFSFLLPTCLPWLRTSKASARSQWAVHRTNNIQPQTHNQPSSPTITSTQPQTHYHNTQPQHTTTTHNHNPQPQHTTTTHTSTQPQPQQYSCMAGGHGVALLDANWRPWRHPDANSPTFKKQSQTKLEDPQAKSKATKPTTMAACASPWHENK